MCRAGWSMVSTLQTAGVKVFYNSLGSVSGGGRDSALEPVLHGVLYTVGVSQTSSMPRTWVGGNRLRQEEQ